jgi:hypothetical protein
VAAVAIVLGGTRDGDYCSPWGQINRHGARYHAQFAGKTVAYLSEGISGLPPRWHCSVYEVDPAPGIRIDESNAAELVREDPSPRLIVSGAIPGNGAYLWIYLALLLPPAIWGLVVSLDSARTTR